VGCGHDATKNEVLYLYAPTVPDHVMCKCPVTVAAIVVSGSLVSKHRLKVKRTIFIEELPHI
jgi:hypothetical protein